jgi:phenylalanyl-tRNA synthetase alpha chain
MFTQVEVLYVDEYATVSELKGVLEKFTKSFFDDDVKIRLRPSYFPFTEPSFEVDISCIFCGGKGCPVCKNTGWVEVLGSGMVHPNVFKSVGYPDGKYKGFAIGMGVERLAMLKYGINDIRHFYRNDLRFLRQF